MTILEILYQIKQTNSRKEKEKIIYNNNSVLLKRIFYLAYEPLKVFYIQKIPENMINFTNRDLKIEDIHIELFNILEDLSNRVYTGNAAIDRLMQLCDNVSYDTFDLILKILNKDLRIGVGEKTLRNVYGENFITNFQIQLANKYDMKKDYNVDSWFATPKLDGLRGIMRDSTFLSRNGKYIYGFEDIEIELKFLQQRFGINLFDGELYSKNIPFQKIQSIVMRQKSFDLKNKIKYYVFAIDFIERKFKNTEMMYRFMHDIGNKFELNHVVFVSANKIKNKPKEIYQFTRDYINFGYEGSMLRHPEKYISSGRDDYLLKNKLMREVDLEIIEVVEGEKKNEGKMGALLCTGYVEGERVMTEVGSGFSDEEREEIFKNKNNYKGKFITVKYQNLTDNRKSLRFPVKIAFKKDR